MCHTRGETEESIVQATKHASEGIHPGFETQVSHHRKFKTGVSVEHKRTIVIQFFKKFNYIFMTHKPMLLFLFADFLI